MQEKSAGWPSFPGDGGDIGDHDDALPGDAAVLARIRDIVDGEIAWLIPAGRRESLQKPRTPYISPKRFSKALGVQVAGLASLAGVHRNTLRNLASERLHDKLREMLKVIFAAATLTVDISKAIYWYRNEPIADYDYRTAAELVADGHAEAVMAHLRDLENGASG